MQRNPLAVPLSAAGKLWRKAGAVATLLGAAQCGKAKVAGQAKPSPPALGRLPAALQQSPNNGSPSPRAAKRVSVVHHTGAQGGAPAATPSPKRVSVMAGPGCRSATTSGR